MNLTEKRHNELLTLSSCLPGFLLSLAATLISSHSFMPHVQQDRTSSLGGWIQGMSCIVGIQLVVQWLTYKAAPSILDAPWKKRALVLNLPILVLLVILTGTYYVMTRPQMMLRRMTGLPLPASIHAQYLGGTSDGDGEFLVVRFSCVPQELQKFIEGLGYGVPLNVPPNDGLMSSLREYSDYQPSPNKHWRSAAVLAGTFEHKTFIWSDEDTNAFFLLSHSIVR